MLLGELPKLQQLINPGTKPVRTRKLIHYTNGIERA